MTDESTMRRLLEARGMLLDGLTSLRNVEQLACSARVGPRSLRGVLPDAVSACHSLALTASKYREAAVELSGARKHLAAYDELTGFILRELSQLAEGVAGASGSLSPAKRLSLEAMLTRHTAFLSAALSLLELLSQALVGRQADIDITDLLQQTHQPVRPVHSTRSPFAQPHAVEVELILPAKPLLVHTNTGVALGLVSFGAGFLSKTNGRLWQLSAQSIDGKVRLELAASERSGRDPRSRITLPALPWLKITPSSLALAAELAGADIVSMPESGAMQVEWPLVQRVESSPRAAV